MQGVGGGKSASHNERQHEHYEDGATCSILEIHASLIIIQEMSPRFSELNKVRVIREEFEDCEGFVIASQFREGRWIYKISFSEDPKKSETFDNWIPEEWLELTK